tara:strand:+ start:1269 stop:1550 length:282 start_codon:yes stop_codon:yes gene_type:complete
MRAIEKAKEIYDKSIDCKDMKKLTTYINEVVEIYQEHDKEVKEKIDMQDFRDVNNVDFNEWAHDQQDDIERIYQDLRSDLGSLSFEQNGFSII